MNLKISARWLCLFFSLLLGVVPTAKLSAALSTNVTQLPANFTEKQLRDAVGAGGLITFSSNAVFQLTGTVPITNDVVFNGQITNITFTTNITVTNFILLTTNAVITTNITSDFTTNIVTNIVDGMPVVTNEVTNITVTNFVTNMVPDTSLTNLSVITTNTNVPTLGDMVGFTGDGSVLLFQVFSNATVVFDHIQFSNGVSAYGGAISNGGNLICSNAYFANNRAIGRNGRGGTSSSVDATDGINGLGGAIFNSATSTLYQCYFAQNSALGGDGGLGRNGADGSLFGKAGGRGGNGGFGIGGAIYNNTRGYLTIIQTAFNDNLASGGLGNSPGGGGAGSFPGTPGDAGFGGAGYGGAIYNQGTNIISQSLFVNNLATGGNSMDQLNRKNGPVGGAALGGALCNIRVLSLDNSTVVSNICAAGQGGGAQAGVAIHGGRGGSAGGGGIYNAAGAVKTFSLSLTNCTLAGGSVTNGHGGLSGTGNPKLAGPPGLARGGNLCVTTGTAKLVNTILAYGFPTNSFGSLRSSSNNIVSDNSAAFVPRTPINKNLRNTDPKLLPLADNGGVTFTMALGSGSPATTNGVDTNLPFDQRGTNRLSPFDVGAFESVGPFTISGRISFGTNHAVANAFIDVTTTNADPVLTQTNDAQGNFSFVVPRGGYIFTPRLLDTNLMLVFKPSAVTNKDVTGDINNLNFAADSLTAKGTVKNKSGIGLSGVTITATNTYFGQDFSITSGVKGVYLLSGLPAAGTNILTPTATNAVFIPPSVVVTPTNTNVNFILIPTYQVAGVLAPKPGSGLQSFEMAQIPILLRTNVSTNIATTLTDFSGKFSFTNVISGTYYLATDSTNITFAPTKILVVSNATKLKLLGTRP